MNVMRVTRTLAILIMGTVGVAVALIGLAGAPTLAFWCGEVVHSKPLSRAVYFSSMSLVLGQPNGVSLLIRASHPCLQEIVGQLLTQAGYHLAKLSQAATVHEVIDQPPRWAFEALKALPRATRRRTVVSTAATHPVYLDCLALYRVSGVFVAMDEAAANAAIHAASLGMVSYRPTSGLTPTELRIVRLLLQGHETREIARRVRVTEKTVNTHISNALGKLGYKNRVQLVARVLGYGPE